VDRVRKNWPNSWQQAKGCLLRYNFRVATIQAQTHFWTLRRFGPDLGRSTED
jgi:hypothetical protein